MAVTEFGKAIRKARCITNDTLITMAESVNKSPAFLSAVETGRTRIPLEFVNDIIVFFGQKNYIFEENLKTLAMVQNENAPLDGLSFQHKMLVAGFANSSFNKEELDQICNLLNEIHNVEQKDSNNGRKLK